MTIREFYEKTGGSYSEAVGRMMKDTLVQRFALKFLKDPSFAELQQNLQAGNLEEAFRAAHTLKGVSKNLAFTRLGDSASQITEDIRAGELESAKRTFLVVQQDYDRIVEALNQLGE